MQAAEALEKLKKWCAYQERSHTDAKRKLYQLRVSALDADAVIAALVEENYLNEERFALAFAGGKFRIKGWGKQKIKMELKKHGVSEYCIKKALKTLEEEDYEKKLSALINKKLSLAKQSDKRKLYISVYTYAVSKGFENNLVKTELNKLLGQYHDEH